MRKLPNSFYKEINDLRASYGDVEYGRDDILPASMSLVEKYLKGGSKELLRDATIQILDRLDKSDDRSGEGLFDYDDHVALGGTRRIKRGAMNLDQHERRKIVIDNNKISQDVAWANETKWLNVGIDALKGHSDNTKRMSVVNEFGDIAIDAAE